MAVNHESNKAKNYIEQGLREGLLILCIAFAVFLFIALYSYHPADPGWTSTGHHANAVNKAGAIGAWIADVLLYFFGYVAYIFPLFFTMKAYQLFRHRHEKKALNWPLVAARSAGALLLLLSTSLLLAMYSVAGLGPKSGGIIGDQMAQVSMSYLNSTGIHRRKRMPLRS